MFKTRLLFLHFNQAFYFTETAELVDLRDDYYSMKRLQISLLEDVFVRQSG